MTALLPAARKVAGDTHPAVLTGVINLAAAWNAVGTPRKTIAEMPDALAAARATLGPMHPTTVLAMKALGEAYLNVGQPDQAFPLLSESVAGYRAAGTANTRDGLLARTLLVRSLIGRGRAAAAIEDMRQIVARTEALDGFESLPAVLARQLLGFVLQAANDGAAAAPLIESTLTALQAMPDAPQARIAAVEGQAALARVRLEQSRVDDGVRLFEQAVAAAEAEGESLRGLVYRLKGELGNLYAGLRAPGTKTEPLLRAAFEGLSESLGPAHPAALAPLFDLWSLARRDKSRREVGAIELTLAPRLRAAAEAPEPSEETLGRASMLLRLAIAPGIRDLPRALALAERAAASGSVNVSVWVALAEARLALNQRAGAITAYERAASLAPPGAGRSSLEARIKELKR